jgi:folylpolyglutamate synthase/dihydrofolate synthase
MLVLAAAAANAAAARTAPRFALLSSALMHNSGVVNMQAMLTAAGGAAAAAGRLLVSRHPFSSAAAGDAQADGQTFLASLIDYEKLGVPKAAGVDSSSSSSSSSAKFDLQVMQQLLAELGNPQQQLKVVHVAGTKGKGSVVVLLSALLRASGLKVGTYTSPHLFDIRERVVVGGGAAAGAARGTAAAAAAVSEEDWESLAEQAQAAIRNMQQQQQGEGGDCSTTNNSSSSSSSKPSHFEVVTAMALKHFAQQRVDIAVIETGLGGATDATNVFSPEQLQLAVLTAIGMDHVEALGGSLRSIATAKAGIMKAGVPVVVGPQGFTGSTAAAAAGDASTSRQSQQQQQQQQGETGDGSSSAEVWEVLRAAAGHPDMQCPILAAEHAVQVRVG